MLCLPLFVPNECVGDLLGMLLAWFSLLPIFILVGFITLIIFRRDLHTVSVSNSAFAIKEQELLASCIGEVSNLCVMQWFKGALCRRNFTNCFQLSYSWDHSLIGLDPHSSHPHPPPFLPAFGWFNYVSRVKPLSFFFSTNLLWNALPHCILHVCFPVILSC